MRLALLILALMAIALMTGCAEQQDDSLQKAKQQELSSELPEKTPATTVLSIEDCANTAKRDECLVRAAVAAADYKACSGISDSELKMRCYGEIAGLQGAPEKCHEMLTDAYEQGRCAEYATKRASSDYE
ncbi:hypothetical protein JW826_05730 [Candidatus Woesearchaeota archaeon]|nr:hypothetical protein [Candidatus Woesearchaeota archaeon]